MSKQITKEQIDAVLAEFFKANAGVQVYQALQQMFEKLPEVEVKTLDKEAK